MKKKFDYIGSIKREQANTSIKGCTFFVLLIAMKKEIYLFKKESRVGLWMSVRPWPDVVGSFWSRIELNCTLDTL